MGLLGRRGYHRLSTGWIANNLEASGNAEILEIL